MPKLEEVTETTSKNGKAYIKIKADGQIYSAWDNSKAHAQLTAKEFKVGDTVKLFYDSKTVGSNTYKNLTKLEVSDEKTPQPIVTKSAPANPLRRSDDVQTMIIRQNALRHADELIKLQASISNESVNMDIYFKTAEQIENWIRRN